MRRVLAAGAVLASILTIAGGAHGQPAPSPGGAGAEIPTPLLRSTTTERYFANGLHWVRYQLEITNRDSFPAAMFAAAPSLPSCGTNANSSRTWVDIYTDQDRRLYGFCALNSPSTLGQIWFAVEDGMAPPPQVYVVLHDRQTGRRHRSNLAPVAAAPADAERAQQRIPGAGDWLFVSRVPSRAVRICSARLLRQGVLLTLMTGEDRVPFLTLTSPGWSFPSQPADIQAAFGSAPATAVPAQLLHNVVYLRLDDAALLGRLRSAREVHWTLPSGRFTTEVGGLDVALEAVRTCAGRAAG